jgi:hypothetical protein
MQDTFKENVALLRAVRLLKMEQYAKHILYVHREYLETHLPSYDEIEIVEEYATSDKDPLWTKMVNHLCHKRHRQLIPDPEDFTDFLEHHQRLKKAMQSADAFFASEAKKKYEARQAQWQDHEDEKRARWEKNEVEKRQRIAKEHRAALSLREKMNGKGGSGLIVVSAEEAAWMRCR